MPVRAAARLRARRVPGYLHGGIPVLTTIARRYDMPDPAAGRVVPASFPAERARIRTDVAAFYLSLSHHVLAPDAPPLTSTAAARRHGIPGTHPETAARAAGLMRRPPASQVTAAARICTS
jgi:hypothetical protein